MGILKEPTLTPKDRGRLARISSRVGDEKLSEKLFAEKFAAYLHENFDSPVQVAAAFRVRERTAENWWNGLNRPNGETVNDVWLRDPGGARRWLGGAA